MNGKSVNTERRLPDTLDYSTLSLREAGNYLSILHLADPTWLPDDQWDELAIPT